MGTGRLSKSSSGLIGGGGAATARSSANPAGPGSSSFFSCASARSTSSIDSKIGSSNVAWERRSRSSGGASFPISIVRSSRPTWITSGSLLVCPESRLTSPRSVI